MNQACRMVIKYFSCLLGNAVLSGPTWITQSSQQRFVVSGVVVCQLVCRLAVDILNIMFSHALSICRLVDLFDAKMCELTLQMILLCNCSLSLNVYKANNVIYDFQHNGFTRQRIATRVNDGSIFNDFLLEIYWRV